MNIDSSVKLMIESIDKAPVPEEQKKEAKQGMAKLLSLEAFKGATSATVKALLESFLT